MLRSWIICLALTFFASLAAQSEPRVQLILDTSEAEQALVILHKQAAHQSIESSDWIRMFETVPYQWLKAREAARGLPLTDEAFKAFLTSPGAVAREREWRDTLEAMEQADMTALGSGVLAWLPEGSTIHARVFPEIKPRTNSFVWTKEGSGPAIFLFLERQSRAKFENTVSHECHHIGLSSLAAQQEVIQARLPENVKTTLKWMSAFGEGEAMLAAAGSDDRHPHWEDDASARALWDGDMTHLNSDIEQLQQLFTDILDTKLKDDAAIRERAAPFWGDVQGAWYTVGYEMAVLVDKQYGRQVLDQCLLDPRLLLTRYNQIAIAANSKGATLQVWSPEFLDRLHLPQ